MVSWWSAKKPRKQTRKAPRWVEKAENRMEYFNCTAQYVREVSDSGEMICTITVEGSDVVWIQKWAKKDSDSMRKV